MAQSRGREKGREKGKEKGNGREKRNKKEKNKKQIKPDLRQRAAEAGAALREPRTIPSYLERGLVRMWRLRGGSWYGIGYVCTFLFLEAQMIVEDVSDATDVVSFATSQIFESILRWFTESLGNMIQAFLWPLSLISTVGLWAGLVILIAVHLGFEHFVRPLAESRFPELREDRLEKESEDAMHSNQNKKDKHLSDMDSD